MKVRVFRSKLSGKISCPSSKSYTHRAIAISSLCNGESRLKNVLISRDTLATLKCIVMLGTEVSIIENNVISNNFSDRLLTVEDLDRIRHVITSGGPVEVSNTQFELEISGKGGGVGFNAPNDVLPADNSGTTIRLLTSMCALVADGYSVLSGDASLRKRPMGDLIKALTQLGVNCFSTNTHFLPPLVVKGGGILGGHAQISGKISSQFLSSLLLAGVFSKQGISLEILGNQVSKPYIESTLHIMNHYGVKTDKDVNKVANDGILFHELASKSPDTGLDITAKYLIPKQMEYNPTDFQVPGDFSTAALLFSAAFLTESLITIANLDFKTPQGDMSIIDIITEMGGKININETNGTAVIDGRSELCKGVFDLNKTPDLLPVVAILALKAKGITKIHGISHARYKETDRVANIASQLVKFGAKVVETEDSIEILPPKMINNSDVQSFGDHRLFMAFTIAGLSTSSTTIDGADSVDVSYPNFVNDLRNMGAQIEYYD